MNERIKKFLCKFFYHLQPNELLFDTHTPDAFPVGKVLGNFHCDKAGYVITKVFNVAQVRFEVYGKPTFEKFYAQFNAPPNGFLFDA